MNPKIRILFIAFSDSIHVSRWLEHLDRSVYEIHFFASVPFRTLHPDIKNITVHDLTGVDQGNTATRTLSAYPIYTTLERIMTARVARRFVRGKSWIPLMKKALARVIRNVKPQIIHTMETQQAGYLMSEIASNFNNIPWVHSTWGIDLHFFSHLEAHRTRLQTVLQNIRQLIVEGERDATIARELGYTGKIETITSVGGGFKPTFFEGGSQSPLPSSRKVILLKGYEGHERLAGNALAALRKIKDALKGYEVNIYSCHKTLLPVVAEIESLGEFAIKVLPDQTHRDLLGLTSAARVSITNNLSDGVPNTMLEAMALGAFPIQSNTAITEGLINDGVNGILTIATDVDNIAAAILRALKDDPLVDRAAEINVEIIKTRLSFKGIQKQIDAIYQRMAEEY